MGIGEVKEKKKAWVCEKVRAKVGEKERVIEEKLREGRRK